MGYTLELSLQLCKHANINSLKEIIIEKARILKCIDIYHFHETEKHNKKYVHKNIFCIQFNYEDIDKLKNFIIFIKKINNVNIESVYEDNNNYRVIYASSHYQKNMIKQHAKLYKNNKRQRAYSDTEYVLYKALFNI